eukprot:TRINITY_DN10345_c0_g1_i1.p1 TRINITY_DN10345_c0_g1~~TRINITY_DN10345_c0_g1_i1.p1  ORF type:complete len:397 (+),score=42.74 TRINITY_DN10345_c0_g1_i1:54-1244(+)
MFSKRRYYLLLYLFLAELICYLDRTNLGVAIIFMKQFGFDDETKGVILGSFYIGYILTQIPASILIKKYGGYIILQYAVFFWSILTIAIPFVASNLSMLLFFRVLIGLVEGVTFPAVYAIFGNWVPVEERASSMSSISLGPIFGTFVALIITPYFCMNYGWESIFYTCGFLGIFLVMFANWLQLSNEPDNNVYITQEELNEINQSKVKNAIIEKNDKIEKNEKASDSVPWSKFFREPSLYGVVFPHFCSNFSWFILISWIPIYYTETLKIDEKLVGLYSCLPYLFCTVTSLIFGKLSDHLITKQNYKIVHARKLFQGFSFLGPSFFFGLLIFYKFSDTTTMLFICLAFALFSCHYSGLMIYIVDMGGPYAQNILSISNTFASFLGFLENLACVLIL